MSFAGITGGYLETGALLLVRSSASMVEKAVLEVARSITLSLEDIAFKHMILDSTSDSVF